MGLVALKVLSHDAAEGLGDGPAAPCSPSSALTGDEPAGAPFPQPLTPHLVGIFGSSICPPVKGSLFLISCARMS